MIRLGLMGMALCLLGIVACSRTPGGTSVGVHIGGVSGTVGSSPTSSSKPVSSSEPVPAEPTVPYGAEPILPSVTGGNGGGNAGDPDAMVRYSGLEELTPPIDTGPLVEYHASNPDTVYTPALQQDRFKQFYVLGYRALWALLFLVEDGYQFKGATELITEDDVYDAMQVLEGIKAHPERFKFLSPLWSGDRPVTAKNYPDGTIEFDPLRWDAGVLGCNTVCGPMLRKGRVAAHEALSLIPRHLERTDFYPFSSAIEDYPFERFPEGEGRFLRLLTYGDAPVLGNKSRYVKLRYSYRQIYRQEYASLLSRYSHSEIGTKRKARYLHRLLTLVSEAREIERNEPKQYDSEMEKDWLRVMEIGKEQFRSVDANKEIK